MLPNRKGAYWGKTRKSVNWRDDYTTYLVRHNETILKKLDYVTLDSREKKTEVLRNAIERIGKL